MAGTEHTGNTAKPTGAATSTTTPVIGGGASPGNAAKALFMRNGK